MAKNILAAIVSIFIFILPGFAYSISTEFGVSSSRKRNTFDANNYLESEFTSGTVSLYFFERIALEFNYTKGLGVRGEKASVADPQRTTVQNTEVYGTDLVLMLAGRQTPIQPFIKGGISKISRRQEIKVEDLDSDVLEPEVAVVPNYGGGLKLLVSERFSIKIGYDVWQTPIGNNAKTDDTMLHVGVSWML